MPAPRFESAASALALIAGVSDDGALASDALVLAAAVEAEHGGRTSRLKL